MYAMATSDSAERSSSATVEQQIRTRLEALKLVSDWSKGAILIQTAGLGAVGALLRELPSSGWMLALVIALCAAFVYDYH